MLQKIRSLLKKTTDEPRFLVEPHEYGVTFTSDEMEACRAGSASELLQLQFVSLRILAEQGIANELSNGFDIISEEVVQLEQAERELLGLPRPWPGEFTCSFTGQTWERSFAMHVECVLPSGERIKSFRLTGPFLSLSEQETYCPDSAQWLLLDTLTTHAKLSPDERDQRTNLLAVKRLQEAETMGLAADLSHFRDLDVLTPDGITFSANQQSDGSLSLLPSMVKEPAKAYGAASQDDAPQPIATPEEVSKRIDGLKKGGPVFRVRNSLVVLDEERLKAVEEILSNQTIPANQVRRFLESPGAFLDGALVDFDLGFSMRVRGATEFEPAYFGETDSSETDWTGCSGLSRKPALPLSGAGVIIDGPEDIAAIEDALKDAREKGEDVITVKGQDIILGPVEDDNSTLVHLRDNIKTTLPPVSPPPDDVIEGEKKSRATVDIIKEDDEHELENKLVPSRRYHYPGEVRLQNCKRTPFSYQEEGIRWLLGLATNNGKMNWESEFVGGVLADDMGLGKTFMSLAAATEYGRMQQEAGKPVKPCLVVAPLSLLQNWREEVELAFDPIPFRDIILLQSKEDLPRFRARKGNELMQLSSDIGEDLSALRFALKVGASWGDERLDMPNRLVLATYQTLRDFQFSLCRVDWGFVVFDEAQNIKNPNSLQTRAAKGLKADVMIPATGTPVENGLMDFWCLFDTACPGLLHNYQSFRKQYVMPIKQAGDKIHMVRERVGKELKDAVGNLMLRRTKEDELDGIPNKEIIYYEEEMRGTQLKWYEAVLGTVDVRANDEPRGPAVLKALHSLRDVSLHPGLLNGGQPVPTGAAAQLQSSFMQSGKLVLLRKILNDIQKRGEKVIIFAIRKRFQAYLAMALGSMYGLPIDVVNGTVKTTSKANPDATRIGMIRRFEEQPGFNILIMSPIAAGVGLTVVGANNVIHLERHWNPAKEAQATDRVYRIGQKKDVYVHIPLLTHPEIPSFDVHLDALLKRKEALKDAIVTPSEVSPDEFITGGVLGTSRTTTAVPFLAEALDGDLAWETFEAVSALALAAQFSGEAMLTSHPNDWGADAVITSDSQVVLVQSKNHPNGVLQSESAVREVYGARPKYEQLLGRKIDKLIVATSAPKVAARVRDAAKQYDVEIWHRKKLGDILDRGDISYERVYGLLDAVRFPGLVR